MSGLKPRHLVLLRSRYGDQAGGSNGPHACNHIPNVVCHHLSTLPPLARWPEGSAKRASVPADGDAAAYGSPSLLLILAAGLAWSEKRATMLFERSTNPRRSDPIGRTGD